MKVTCISGSPRNGNSKKLIEKIASNISNKNPVKCVYLEELNIQQCNGCLRCEDFDGCCFEDDMLALSSDIIDSELLIIATPVYFDSVPSILKNFLDRSNVFTKNNELKGKKLFIIVCGQADETSWNRARDFLVNYADIMGMEVVGTFSFFARATTDLTDSITSQVLTLVDNILN